MDGNLSHAGALARSPTPLVFDAFVLLYPHFLPPPVRNVTNRSKRPEWHQKRGPERNLFTAELILKGSGLLRTAAYDKVNEPLNSHKANVEKCPNGKTDEAYFRCLYRPVAINCSRKKKPAEAEEQHKLNNLKSSPAFALHKRPPKSHCLCRIISRRGHCAARNLQHAYVSFTAFYCSLFASA